MKSFINWTNRNHLLAACLGLFVYMAILIAASAWDAHTDRVVRAQMVAQRVT